MDDTNGTDDVRVQVHLGEYMAMIITLVVSICFQLSGQPVCHEEVVSKHEADNPTMTCSLSMPELADWKAKSRYSSDDWTIGSFHCEPGDYVPKDAI